MLSEAKHPGCIYADVHEIDFVERCFFAPLRMTLLV